MSTKTLRPYQSKIGTDAAEIMSRLGCVYIAAEVRCGKTAASMETCRLMGFKNVLFLTKKKAMPSIRSDYIEFGFDEHFEIEIINDESMHKIDNPAQFDVIIHDEHHRFAALAKPGKATKLYRDLFFDKPMIFLSGTPTPENFSQIYHQFWVTKHTPFAAYKNFYRWCDDYVDVKQKKINSFWHNDYTHAKEDMIMSVIKPYMIYFTQSNAGFTSEIDEEILYVDMKESTHRMCDKLRSDLVVEGKQETILGDTPAKLMQKLHQMYSGTVKFESGNSMTLDTTKAEFLYDNFGDRKIGIFYVFKEELQMLKSVYGDHLTESVEEFDSTDKSIALQIVSGREGISLRNAEYLIFFNIAHSATSYWQARDRMTTMDRLVNKVFWLFSRDGIEDKIYKVVKTKKKYTINHFKKDYL